MPGMDERLQAAADAFQRCIEDRDRETAESVLHDDYALVLVHPSPAVMPVPGFAIKLLYGGMAKLVVEGQYARPRRTLDLGYEFRHPDLDEALRSALRDT